MSTIIRLFLSYSVFFFFLIMVMSSEHVVLIAVVVPEKFGIREH